MLHNAATVDAPIRTQALVVDVGGNCSYEKNILFRLAFLITGDKAQAEDALMAAYELTEQGETPFRDWLFEWAKSATVKSAIRGRLDDIRECGAQYKPSHCKHPEHLHQIAMPELQGVAEWILRLDPDMVIAELDPFARAILLLRGALGASVRECAIQLTVSTESVLAAQCRITTWLTKAGKEQLPELKRPVKTECPSVLAFADLARRNKTRVKPFSLSKAIRQS
ncbi:MAG TPA: hypothetical protein VMU05_20460 [Dongiaceae bacterium]|nr:hypothetical protein [Dongiaceae bacterium]